MNEKMKPSDILLKIRAVYGPDFYEESFRLIRIEAKLQAIIEYLDEQSDKSNE